MRAEEVLKLLPPVPLIPEVAVLSAGKTIEAYNELSVILAETVGEFLTVEQQERWVERYFGGGGGR